MTFSETPLKGFYIVDLAPNIDERGFFERIYCRKEFRNIGFNKEFVQMNYSVNKLKHTFRGFHFQKPPFCETKLITCISGRVSDTIIDIRKGSPTFLQSFTIELSADTPQSLIVPEGFAHGYITLENNSSIFYFHSKYYAPRSACGLNYKDPALSIKLCAQPEVISEHDCSHPFLEPNFKGIEIAG